MSEYTPVKSNLCLFSTVPDAAVSTVIMAQNLARKGGSVVNTSSATLYLRMDGGTATATTGYNVALAEGDYFEIPCAYTGVVTGIWSSDAGGAANVAQYV